MIRFASDWWRSMGIWSWPNLVLIGIAIWLAAEYEAVAGGWVHHGARSVGDIRVSFRTQGRIRPGATFRIRLEANDAASITFGFGNEALTNERSLDLPAATGLELEFTAPRQTDAPLIMELIDDQGNIARWNLGRLYH